MATTNSARRYLHQPSRPALGPQITFAGAVLVSFAALAISATMLARDLVLPLISALFFVLACVVAVVAWSRGPEHDARHLTYWDVAGALIFFGICAGAMIDPEQMARVIEGAQRGN